MKMVLKILKTKFCAGKGTRLKLESIHGEGREPTRPLTPCDLNSKQVYFPVPVLSSSENLQTQYILDDWMHEYPLYSNDMKTVKQLTFNHQAGSHPVCWVSDTAGA